jgi:hypothetical protein
MKVIFTVFLQGTLSGPKRTRKISGKNISGKKCLKGTQCGKPNGKTKEKARKRNV